MPFKEYKNKYIVFATTQRNPSVGSENLWVAAAAKMALEGWPSFALVPARWESSPEAKWLSSSGVSLCFYQARGSIIARIFNYVGSRLRVPDIGSALYLEKDSKRILNSASLIVLTQGGLFDSVFTPVVKCLLQRAKCPYLLNLRSGRPVPGILSAQIREKSREIIRNASGVVLASMANLADIERELYYTPTKVLAIHSPVKNWDEVSRWPDNHLLQFACVCRCEVFEKGLDLLLDAAAALRIRGYEFKVKVYGSGPDFEYFQRLVHFRGMSDSVILCGPYSSLEKVWAENHICLVTSRSEGLPQSLMEGMAACRPVVATPVGGNRELVVNGLTGFLATATTSESLAEAMEKCFHFKDSLRDLGLNARRSITEKLLRDPAESFMDFILKNLESNQP